MRNSNRIQCGIGSAARPPSIELQVSNDLHANRHEGLAPTAEAARCRLEALGSMDPVANPATSHEALAALKASKADLKSWTVSD